MVDSAKEEVLLTLGNKLKTKMAAQTRTLYKSVAQVGDSPCAMYFPLDGGEKQLTSVIKHLLRCNKSLAQEIIKKRRILRERAKARPTPMMTTDYDYVTCVADLRTEIVNMEALLILNSVFLLLRCTSLTVICR